MQIDLDTFLTTVYCITSDLYQRHIAWQKPRRRGKRAELSDEEVVTLAILGEWQSTRSEREFGRYYTWTTEGSLRWRTNDELPPASQFISSPHDPDARYSQKRSTSWVGYKVHLTESCDPDLPHLITHVETTPATTADDAVTPIIHAALEQHDLLPAVHLADTGFIDAELIVDSNHRYQLDLLGPVRPDNHRQEREGRGFAAQDFVIDWQSHQATYPTGCTSLSWAQAIDKPKNPVVKIKFSMRDCRPCVHRPHCTSAKRRTVTLRPQEQYQALQAARLHQTTPEFKQAYGQRAGIEGTLSQRVRTCDLRRTRYIGRAKTHLHSALGYRPPAEFEQALFTPTPP